MNIYPSLSVSVYFSLFLSEAQDSCAPAAVLQLRLAHSGQSINCGSSLDRAVLLLFRQVQQSPCQCHHVFIAEGNPAAEPRLPYVLSSYTVGALVSADRLTLSSTSLTSLFFIPSPFPCGTGDMSLQHTQDYMLCNASTLCLSY